MRKLEPVAQRVEEKEFGSFRDFEPTQRLEMKTVLIFGSFCIKTKRTMI
jgi:hypothetical protein